MSRLDELQARQALQTAGLPGQGRIERATSVTNEVWMTPDHVVRLGRDLTGRLAREAALVPSLPTGVGCPPILHTGQVAHLTYVISERVPGRPLAHVWSWLDASERAHAVTSIASRLVLLHDAPTPSHLSDLDDPPQPIGAPGGLDPVDPLRETLALAGRVPGIDQLLLSEASERVESLADCVADWSSATLVHGDLTFGNVLWHDGEVTALLDFEFARGAPADIDLDIILRMCAYPGLFVDDEHVAGARPEDYLGVRRQLALAHPSLFGHPRSTDRLRLYAIAFTARELAGLPLVDPANADEPGHPQSRLAALLSNRSHLDR